jgi:hypothetical protein
VYGNVSFVKGLVALPGEPVVSRYYKIIEVQGLIPTSRPITEPVLLVVWIEPLRKAVVSIGVR